MEFIQNQNQKLQWAKANFAVFIGLHRAMFYWILDWEQPLESYILYF